MNDKTNANQSMRFQCPHCGVVLETDDSIEGMQVTCPACRGGFAAVPLEAEPASVPPETHRPPRREPRGHAKRRSWVWGAVAVLALALLGAAWAMRPPSRAGATRSIRLPGGAKMEMVWCPPGTFVMGRPEGEEWRKTERKSAYDKINEERFLRVFTSSLNYNATPEDHEYARLWFVESGEDLREKWETQHQVTLTKGFWMAKTEVTQKQWESVMGNNPSGHKSPDLPVENVSWGDCKEFCARAGLKLPTEAQWEYACRAGTTERFAGTGNLDDMGWYDENSRSEGDWHEGDYEKPQPVTHEVGLKQPNAWGLYDMHGNVWEWCEDSSGIHMRYTSDSETDPTGAGGGEWQIMRGGCCVSSPEECRSACRRYLKRLHRVKTVGFRPVKM